MKKKTTRIFQSTTTSIILLAISFFAQASGEGGTATSLPRLGKCNVVWDSPSATSLGSMPIGNGDIGANVWVEPSGDIVLLLSKTDSYDEFNRLLKLGRIRIKTTPSLVAKGQPFRQELSLLDGAIHIECGGIKARVWADANHPVIQVDLDSPKPAETEIHLEIWRTEKRKLNRVARPEKEQYGTLYNRPEKLLVNPDTVLPQAPGEIAWCHHNVESQWKANLELTALGDEVAKGKDPILHRTFGAVIRGKGLKAVSGTVMKTVKPSKSLSIRIHPLTKISDSPGIWRKAAAAQADALPESSEARFASHQRWWKNYWQTSWIYLGGAEADVVMQAYALQRFMNACAGRGSLPIKFNGSIFTVDQLFDPDYRRWGGAYWWQNTRLIYWSMLYSGNYGMMKPLFRMFMEALPLRKAATRKYYGHSGAFYPETMYFWGNFTDGNYGLNRKGKPDGLTDNTFIRRYWQGSLELVAMMLDYYDHTQDTRFRDEMLLPMAKEITTFFDQHWKRGKDGKIFYSPAQSLETWHVATNPLPEIVALNHLLPRLLELPAGESTKAAWRRQLADQPEIPTTGKGENKRLLPAKTYSKRSNMENPELYAVFPYRSYTLLQGGDALKIALNTWNARRNRSNVGWQQQPIKAAMLGLTKEAKALTVQRAKNKAKGYRFPGFYGPNYDWTPDQDQISVFMIGLQRMLMLCEGKRILLLPAWPKEWEADFKLHAPYQTVVEGKVKNGKVVELKVTPESRRKDVEIMPAAGQP